LRNTVALTVQPGSGRLFAVVHGRDQLGGNWGYSDQQNADLPAEELVAVSAGDDFGWPYCYYDQQLGKLVLAPEYGGDGSAVGRCAEKKNPLIGFPGHWGPLAIAFYGSTQFPLSYREGAFVAFHGSWNRSPLPQAGFRVVFVPFAGGLPTGQYSTFATGARGPTDLRASGVAVGPDGSLYIAAQDNGAIWRVMAKQ
ncbi:MAG: PQQ-dependent sugar dehydrogenase, partial [Gemmatimonadales bacterium]